jgi:alkylation response protein AidB-like acyl-CoA dehydrogenase
MRWIGLAKRALEITCERAVSRRSHGQRLADHQMVQDFLYQSRSEIEAARLITFQAAWKMDKMGARAARVDISLAKAYTSRMLLGVLDRGIQICGAMGYSGDLPLELWYRVHRFGPIGDGPDEVHKVVVARDTLKGARPVEGWPSDHVPSLRPVAEQAFARLLAEARDAG